VSRALSLPHEHGGYLTIAGAATAGVVIAQARGPAVAVGAVVAAAFFARAPVEELVRGRAARFDRVGLAILAAIIAAGAAVLAGPWRAVALIFAAAIVSGSALVRRARRQRATWFETCGMVVLGASAGLVARAGGAELHASTAIAIVFATHCGLAVPLVRSEVRPRERAHARPTAAVVLVGLSFAAIAIDLVGGSQFLLALLPRTLHALVRAALPSARTRPNVVGVRETAMLAVVILLAIVA